MQRTALIAGLASSLLSAAAAAAGPPVQLQPHRAVYDMKLSDAASGSGIVDAEGLMVFEWAESCDGWTIQQKALFDVYSAEGGTRTEVSFTSWENKKGTAYSFNAKTMQDGDVVEDLRGEAKLAPGEGGTAIYQRPADRTTELPPETLFSGGHTILLLQEAMAGTNRVLRPVFLGQREDEPMLVNAMISAEHADEEVEAEWKELLSGPYWNMHLAFFGQDDTAVPAFEVREKLYANGIIGEATVIYDAFSFTYALRQLEALPVPTC